MNRTLDQRLLVVSPVRNEVAHLERVAAAMAAQTRPPDEWVIVDDVSDDGTQELLDTLAAQIPFVRVVSAEDELDPAEVDRLALAAAPRAFNVGLGHGRDGFTHVAKLDGDVKLRPDYYDRLLSRFAGDDRLGI